LKLNLKKNPIEVNLIFQLDIPIYTYKSRLVFLSINFKLINLFSTSKNR